MSAAVCKDLTIDSTSYGINENNMVSGICSSERLRSTTHQFFKVFNEMRRVGKGKDKRNFRNGFIGV